MKVIKVVIPMILMLILCSIFIAGCTGEKQVGTTNGKGYIVEYSTGTPGYSYVIDTLTNNVYLARQLYEHDYEFTLLYNDDGTLMRASDILNRIKVAMEKDEINIITK